MLKTGCRPKEAPIILANPDCLNFNPKSDFQVYEDKFTVSTGMAHLKTGFTKYEFRIQNGDKLRKYLEKW